MRDPGGGLWVVGSEGRLGAGQSVCVRARTPSRLRPRAPGAPALGQQTAAAFGLVLFSSFSLCPRQGSARNLSFVRALKGAWVPRSLPAPQPRLCLQMRKQTRQTGKSHMKSRRCAASSDSASSAPSVPRLCLSSAFQQRPASLAVGGKESTSPHLGLPPSPSLWGHASLEPPGPGFPLRSY